MTSVKHYLRKHRKAIGISMAIIAFGVAIMYLKFVPQETMDARGVQKVILTYGHTFCWLLLSGASAVWATTNNGIWPTRLARGALVSYVLFMMTLLMAS